MAKGSAYERAGNGGALAHERRYAELMAVRLVNNGIYDAREFARLLGQSVDRVVGWSLPGSRGERPLLTPLHGRAFGFRDLISGAVISQLSGRRVKAPHIRSGIWLLAEEFHDDAPLALRPVEIERQFSFLDACERAVDVGLARAAALRRSVLEAAFEGKLVPQDPGDEPASVLFERIRAERELEAQKPKPTARKRAAKLAIK